MISLFYHSSRHRQFSKFSCISGVVRHAICGRVNRSRVVGLIKLSSNQSNPAYNSVFNSKFISVFERKPTQLPPLAVRASCDMKQIGFKKSDVVLSVIPSTTLASYTTCHRPEPPLLGQKQYSSRNF